MHMSACVCVPTCVWRTERVSHIFYHSIWSSEATYYLNAEIQMPVFMIVQQEFLILEPSLHPNRSKFYKISISIHNIIHKILVYLDYKF